MPSDFEVAFNTLAVPIMQDYFGVTVCIARGALVSAEFTARRQKVDNIAIGQDVGIKFNSETWDFVIPASGVEFGGEVYKPKQGDRIIEGEDVYEILPLDEFILPVQNQPGGYEYIVHTKKVDG